MAEVEQAISGRRFVLTDKNCDFPANLLIPGAICYSMIGINILMYRHTESFRIRSCLICFFMADNMTCFLLLQYY